MGVVTKYARSYKDPGSIYLPEPAQAEGRVRLIASGTIAIANGDSIASKHYFGKIASSAILIPSMCILHHEDVTSLTDYDIGLELDGTVIDADALADGLNVSSAGTKSGVASVPITDLGKRVWELASLSLTKDPGVYYDIVGVMKAASTGDKKIAAFFGYAQK
jgi:hypothetical protein